MKKKPIEKEIWSIKEPIWKKPIEKEIWSFVPLVYVWFERMWKGGVKNIEKKIAFQQLGWEGKLEKSIKKN